MRYMKGEIYNRPLDTYDFVNEQKYNRKKKLWFKQTSYIISSGIS